LNVRFVVRQLALLLLVLSVAIVVAAIWAVCEYQFEGRQGEAPGLWALLSTVAFTSVAGGGVWWFSRGSDSNMGRREALLLVALSWFFGAAVSALPFMLWAIYADAPLGHPFRSWVPCYFEAMSGLTTTGATVLNSDFKIEDLPRGILLWRAITHWLGGLGIVVLFVAVLPTLGVGGKRLFQVEATGPSQPGVRPRIKETARILWMIYLGLTALEIMLLRICGMDWFESVCHTFATLATGGFSTSTSSLGDPKLGTVWAQAVIIVFMILAGINFGLYYKMIRGRSREVWKDPELRMYLFFIVAATAVITIFLATSSQPIVTTHGDKVEGIGQSIRHSLFQVVSIQTTTGYCSADFNLWHFVPKIILLGLMFVGGSAGSTGGGIKVIRILVCFKVMFAEVEKVFRPNVVRAVKVGNRMIDHGLRHGDSGLVRDRHRVDLYGRIDGV